MGARSSVHDARISMAQEGYTALSPNRGPTCQPIETWTPAVARREDEIDTSPVYSLFPQHLEKTGSAVAPVLVP